MKLNYQNTQAAFREELERLASIRERIANRLVRVDHRIEAVSAAAEALGRALDVKDAPIPASPVIADPPAVPEEPEFEITGSIREVLQEGSELSAPEIRDALVSRGWMTENYTNPLAIVHTVLNRLVKKGDLGITENKWDKTKSYYDHAAAREREARKQEERAEDRVREEELAAARVKARGLLLHPCLKILRAHPRGISSKAIYRELEKLGIDMSCYSRPASAIAYVLKELPGVRTFRQERNGVVQVFYQVQ